MTINPTAEKHINIAGKKPKRLKIQRHHLQIMGTDHHQMNCHHRLRENQVKNKKSMFLFPRMKYLQ